MLLVDQATTYYRRSNALADLAASEVVKRRKSPRDAAFIWGRYQANAATLAVSTGIALLEEQNVDSGGPIVSPLGFMAGADVLTDFAQETDSTTLSLLVRSMVADAGRSAAGVLTGTRSTRTGYVRYTVGKTCDRCVVLAGRYYRHSTGFLRHLRCDCVMLPASQEASPELIRSPEEALDGGLVTGLSERQLRAIADGADMSQVVNAKRGMRMVNFGGRRVQTTTAGATARGVAGRSLGSLQKVEGSRYRTTSRHRLTPESIYRVTDDREHQLRLLKLHGYIT